MSHGEIFTKPSVVELMLLLSSFDSIDSLEDFRILEPSCGDGEFLKPILIKLLEREDFRERLSSEPSKLKRLICAFELQEHHAAQARESLSELLVNAGSSKRSARALVESWVRCEDFLLASVPGSFDLVIGNPPYVRIEEIEKTKLASYRSLFRSMTDRADIYIPFFEKSLGLLNKRGRLCFICTDRWTKNRYGRALREIVSELYSLDAYIDFYGVDAFLSTVITYPAITLFSKNGRQGETAYLASSFSKSLVDLPVSEVKATLELALSAAETRIKVVNRGRPWLFSCETKKSLIDKIEASFPSLADADCRVHIGAATGANKVFLTTSPRLVEESRLLPCLTSREIRAGEVVPAGKYLVNPWDENGLVDLMDYPLLKRYLEKHREDLEKRHVAKKNPSKWYATIDRIYESRALAPKLFIPDIKSALTVLYDEGRYYANNSLYFIVSSEWDLHALRAVLLVVGPIFIEAYSTKVAGGHFRFQAQHLRRIRIPYWRDLSAPQRKKLCSLGKSFNYEKALTLVSELYFLSEAEMLTLK